MSIASEITRLQTAKANIKTSIENKGVTVSSDATLDTYASLIDSIETGGGSGLTYETGTYTPTSNIARPTISFTNEHTKAPFCVIMVDSTGTSNTTTNTNWAFQFLDIYMLTGKGIYYSSSSQRYAYAQYVYRASSETSLSQTIFYCSNNSDNTASSSTSYPRYWVTNTDFKPSSNSTSRYWRSGRTYKWIAIWL